MDKRFVILLGVLVCSLYIPPIVTPARHRELARRLNTKSFMRRFSPVMMAVGIIALLTDNIWKDSTPQIFDSTIVWT